jgi:hypothetical protein
MSGLIPCRQRTLDDLVEFAAGGFAKAEGEPVPKGYVLMPHLAETSPSLDLIMLI